MVDLFRQMRHIFWPRLEIVGKDECVDVDFDPHTDSVGSTELSSCVCTYVKLCV